MKWTLELPAKLAKMTPEQRVQHDQRETLWQHVLNIKLSIGKCTDCTAKVTRDDCGWFEFDHINPENKVAAVFNLTYQLRPIQEIDLEIAKCE